MTGRRSCAAAGATLVVLGIVGVVVPSASATTTDPTGDTRAQLVAEVERELADERETILAETVTGAMRDDAVVPLVPDDPTFPLAAEDATRPLESTSEEDGETVVTLTSDLLFAFDSAELSDAAAGALAEIVAEIPQDADVAVDGHTDAMGTDERNDVLSRERAESVAAVLRAERPDLTLTVTGHGSSDPVAENSSGGQDDPAGRAQNRRVELTYVGP